MAIDDADVRGLRIHNCRAKQKHNNQQTSWITTLFVHIGMMWMQEEADDNNINQYEMMKQLAV